MYYLNFLVSHTVFVVYWIGLYFGGCYSFLIPMYVFGFLVFLDMICGNEMVISPVKSKDPGYGYLLYTWSMFHVFNICLTACLIYRGQLSVAEFFGAVLSVGIEGGQSVAIAHELLHKASRVKKLFAKILLFTIFYNHFELEHKYGHHIHVATEFDPATAKKNQTLYSFLPQSVFGGIRNAYQIETNNNKYGISNKIIQYLFIYLVLLCLLFWLNRLVFIFVVCYPIVSIFIIESTNYFEHYGLLRKKLDNNKYESVKYCHSWDNDNCISNWILFRIGRHSDHHVRPHKEYQHLIPNSDSPQLPTGYPGCVLLSILPSVWFSIANKRLENFVQKN